MGYVTHKKQGSGSEAILIRERNEVEIYKTNGVFSTKHYNLLLK